MKTNKDRLITMTGSAFMVTVLGMFLMICGVLSTARADIIEYNGVATITSTAFPGDIAVDDIFHVSLTYDDSTTDTNSSTYGGRFNYALLTFVITRDPGNTGTWDPAIGTWDINPSSNHYTNDNGDSMGIQNHGTGLDTLGGIPFHDLTPGWDWDPTVHDLVDNGSGQTLRNIFGDVSPDFVQTVSNLEIRNTDYDSAIGSLVLTPPTTPTPACVNNGDVNLNGSLTSEDAQIAFSIALGAYTPTYDEWCAADCNGDGEVTAGDAQVIFGAVLGLDNCVDPL